MDGILDGHCVDVLRVHIWLKRAIDLVAKSAFAYALPEF